MRIYICQRIRVPFMILCILLVVLSHTAARAQFTIGVWQPGGHWGRPARVDAQTKLDTSFTQETVKDLRELGVDLVINTPRVDYTEVEPFPDHSQDFEESIFRQLSRKDMKAVVQFESEFDYRDLRGEQVLNQWGKTLECYAGYEMSVPLNKIERAGLSFQVKQLVEKWGSWPNRSAFYGYRIGHENAPTGNGGIYNSLTYKNLGEVVDTIRAWNKTRRIITIGDIYFIEKRNEFIKGFFQSTGPANIFQQERHYISDKDKDEVSVQRKLDGGSESILASLDASGRMIKSAISAGRKAEWHFIVNAADQRNTNPTGTGGDHWRDPTPGELKAQVYLALSRGAKGIIYFCYTGSPGNLPVDGWIYKGLVTAVNSSGKRVHNSGVWDNVQMVNKTLRPMGNVLYPLRWVDGFSGSNLPKTFVQSSADSLEFGTFYDPSNGNKNYLLVVNKKDVFNGGPAREVAISLDMNRLQPLTKPPPHGKGQYALTEVVSNTQQVLQTDSSGVLTLGRISLAPGDAKLFRIEKP